MVEGCFSLILNFRMFFKIIFLILLTIILSEVQSCDIQLKLVSETDKEVEVQLIIPGLRLKTEKLSFKKKGERRLVKVSALLLVKNLHFMVFSNYLFGIMTFCFLKLLILKMHSCITSGPRQKLFL